MLCKLWFALFLVFSVISVGAISVNAWQGLKSWYTITMAFGLASQAQAKNYFLRESNKNYGDIVKI